MEVAIPHSLEKDEVRRRLKGNIHQLADHIPGGMAQVESDWPSDDRMTLSVGTLGQTVSGYVDIEVGRVVLVFDLPPALGFLTPMIEAAVKQQAPRLLAPPEK